MIRKTPEKNAVEEVLRFVLGLAIILTIAKGSWHIWQLPW